MRSSTSRVVVVLMALLVTACDDSGEDMYEEEEQPSMEADAEPSDQEGDAGDLPVDSEDADVAEMDAALADAEVEDAAQEEDAEALDAASGMDASGMDAALMDASLPDAMLPDATLPDASKPDASLPDASLPDASPPDASLPDASLPDAGPATFAQVLTIFSSRCANCHGNNGGLTLSNAAAYMELLGSGAGAPAEGPACGSSGKLRVVPNDANGSLLVQKVEGTAGCGSRMPPSGAALTSAQIQTIRSWIAGGAPND